MRFIHLMIKNSNSNAGELDQARKATTDLQYRLLELLPGSEKQHSPTPLPWFLPLPCHTERPRTARTCLRHSPSSLKRRGQAQLLLELKNLDKDQVE